MKKKIPVRENIHHLWEARNFILPYTRHETIFPTFKSTKFILKPITEQKQFK